MYVIAYRIVNNLLTDTKTCLNPFRSLAFYFRHCLKFENLQLSLNLVINTF